MLLLWGWSLGDCLGKEGTSTAELEAVSKQMGWPAVTWFLARAPRGCLPALEIHITGTPREKLGNHYKAEKPQETKTPKKTPAKHQTTKKTQPKTRAFAEMPPGLSDSEPLHLSVRFPNDPACFVLVAAGWDLQWILSCHPEMSTCSSWIFLHGTKAVEAVD